ncbi:NAD(P)H-dependent oxidoreductase subunit E [candidate division KSB1 bacterium]|nr:NAD(P)H-dependent oxidoreductase subunit E [candidate division KSB1 bacterium]RQW07627.1 MAG: 4Fe-4S dicluster domain-containing protein [candidate division KSB1 bacterium]
MGVSTFYTQFRHKPVGEHIIQVCTGTACHVKGSEKVVDAFRRDLHIGEKDDTDPDGQFTVQKVACLGCCTLAPVVQIDKVTYGHVTPESVKNVIRDYLSRAPAEPTQRVVHTQSVEEIGEIRIGLGSCCVASGSSYVQQALEQALVDTNIRTHVKRVGCVGMCHRVPLLEVVAPNSEPVLYDKVEPAQVRDIVLRHFPQPSAKERLKTRAFKWVENLFIDEGGDGFTQHPLFARDPILEAFLGRQRHIVTEHAGTLDPLDMHEYRARGGFAALEKALNSTQKEIIDEVTASGLRGRGGAGFLTGKKWAIARAVEDEQKYIICNGDEGDPGAFMDRMILESYPFRVIEGMIIGAYTIGARQGYLYIRAEYPLAVVRVRHAISQCEKEGLLGENILGSDFSLSLKIMEGAGAFVCGEESALISSLEGKRGMPRFRPPYPAVQGLWGHSTVVNNVETFATIPWILRNGAHEFTKLGTARSTGTKVFSLAGRIARGGLIEVPMGITVREIVEEIGGGIQGGKKFKAVQIGGPSGGCVPASLSDTPIDFEALTKAGTMMGSGGLLVMDESDCMVDIARYFLTFTFDQSCGKCTFCRIGTKHMLEILEKLCAGKGVAGDLEKLQDLAEKTKVGSLCGLGKTAPNPVLSTLKYFRDEYEAHLDGRCPAKKCRALIRYEITDDCIGCTICAQKCPVNAIPFTPHQKHAIVQAECTKCDTCFQVCPVGAVRVGDGGVDRPEGAE